MIGKTEPIKQQTKLPKSSADRSTSVKSSVLFKINDNRTFSTAQLKQINMLQGSQREATIQREERKTSIYNREPQTNNFHKGMEIVDSTSPEAYVHLSRDAAPREHTVNIQANPQYFNGLQEPTKRSHVDVAAPDTHVDLSSYTLANNAHVTLEGRYAYVMTQLAGGFADLAGIKSGPPVVGDFANLNFGSFEDHGRVQKSERDIFTYISNYAEDAFDIVSGREERFEGEKKELRDQINSVESETSSFADHLIQNSALGNLDDGDFVHYGGEPWDPIIPEDLH